MKTVCSSHVEQVGLESNERTCHDTSQVDMNILLQRQW